MMPTAHHAQEDALLDLAYGELPPGEASAVEAHVRGCARCAQALEDIRGVRRAMAPLAGEPAPEAGLDSLLAYAEQAARRTREESARRASPWSRWGLVLASVCTLAVVGVVAHRAMAPGAAEPAAASFQKVQEKAVLAQAPAVVSPAAQAEPMPEAAEEELLGKARMELAQRGASRMERTRALEGLRARDADRRAEWKDEAPAAAPLAGGLAGAPMALAPKASKVVSAPLASASAAAPGASAPVAAAPVARAPVASAPAADVAAADVAEAEAPAPSAGVALGDMSPARPSEGGRAPSAFPAAPTRSAGRAAPGAKAEAEDTPAGLARLAAARRAAGDRGGEAALLERALALRPAGPQRAGLLLRLCEAELALGRATRARTACDRVMADFAGSPEAAAARRLMGQAGGGSSP